MGLHGCNPSGEVDGSKFGKPLPSIGLCMAAASLLCALLMGIDTVHGFRRPRKLWFPCRFFSLNAISLTLLAVATKLPVDLNTAMPRRQDQLAKLSGTVLICTAMANFMISVGNMDVSEMISNISALGILVVTVIVNIGIQMSTGVIYVFLPEHALIMFFMLVSFLILCSTAFEVACVKGDLEITSDEVNTENEQSDHHIEKLKDHVRKSWMKVHTRDPQYVVGRFGTCAASGAFCLLSAVILLQAAFRSFISRSLHFCQGECDYTWSTTLVLISQAIAICVGTIAPVIRWFNAARFRKSYTVEICPYLCLIGILWFWKMNRYWGVISFVVKIVLLVVLIVIKLISLAFLFPMRWLSRLSSYCERREDEEKGSEPESRSNVDLTSFVALLPVEENCLVGLIMTDSLKDIDHWIHRGKSKPLDYYLPELLKKSQGFHGNMEFDSNQVPSLLDVSYYKCWALPLVTLTSIAIAITISLPNNEKDRIKSLRRGVNESLKYVRFIDKNDRRKNDKNDRRKNDKNDKRENDEKDKQMIAADIVWKSIDTHDCWLGNDLNKLAREENTARKILEKLAQLGEKYVSDTTGPSIFCFDPPAAAPPKAFAAESMCRLCNLLKGLETADQIFEWLQKTIVDMLLTCLPNLRQAISRNCRIDSSFEIRVMEENIREAACLVVEVENLWTKLDPSRCFNDIDHWISSYQDRDRPSRPSSTPVAESPLTMTSQLIPQPDSTSTEDPGSASTEDPVPRQQRTLIIRGKYLKPSPLGTSAKPSHEGLR